MIKFLQGLVNSFVKFSTTYESLGRTQNTNKSTQIPIKRPNTYYMRLERIWYSGKSTIGKLYVDGQFECFILEDRVRNQKVYGETAIPEGAYEVVITYSPRFKTKLPLLKNVPGFKGVRIHPGNTPKDTEGCLLPGETRDADFVGRSRKAFNALFKKLEKAKKEGNKIWLTIKN